jgi:NADPH:quinone reductase-like Zn-dependent oxidoreductase
MMRAAVVDRYGAPEVVRVTDLPRPEPRADEVLLRVVATALTSGDARIRAARFPRGFALPARLALGIAGPRRKVLGMSCSGVVEAVGADVRGFAPGDEVCGSTGAKLGAHAEFVAVASTRITHKPATVTHDDAAGVLFGGTTALHFLRKAGVGPGTTVLVNGASGAVGTNAVQIARHLGATVTGVTSTANADRVLRLGADRVIDYSSHGHCLRDVATGTDRFDVVMDTVGNLTIASGRRLLAPRGRLVLLVADLWEMVRARGDVIAGPAPELVADMDQLLQWVADGALVVVHDRAYPLEDIVAAHRRVDTGRKVGNVLVNP